MAELTEIPLELQLKEANRRIKLHQSKGCKFQQFLSPMFLQHFSAIMDNQISVSWDTITGIYDRMPFFPIMLIDTEILDDWFMYPSVWEVSPNLQHMQHVLAMTRYMLPSPYKGQTCHHVQGIICLHSGSSGMHKPVQCPDIHEERQGRLRGPSGNTRQPKVLSPAAEG